MSVSASLGTPPQTTASWAVNTSGVCYSAFEVRFSNSSTLIGSGSCSSSTMSSSFLSPGTTYTGNVWGHDNVHGSGWVFLGSATITTASPPPMLATPASISYPAVQKGAALTVTWSSVVNATSYQLEYATDVDGIYYTVGSYAGTSANTVAPNVFAATQYQFRVKATASGFTDSSYMAGSWVTFATPTPILSSPSFISYPLTAIRGSLVSISWGSVANAQQYIVERFNDIHGWTSGTTVSGTSTSLTVSDLLGASQFAFRVVATAPNHINSPATTGSFGTLTSPQMNSPSFITYATFRAKGANITVQWGAVGNAESYILERRIFTTNVWSAWQSVGIFTVTSGTNALSSGVNDLRYQFRVIARRSGWVDSLPREGQEGFYQRPSSFSWTTAKIAGQPINVSASEWNSFQANINQMREYKGLSIYEFPTVSFDSFITASLYNTARAAIIEMSPSISPPNAVVGTSQVPNPANATTVAASHFNNIVSSLNSIS